MHGKSMRLYASVYGNLIFPCKSYRWFTVHKNKSFYNTMSSADFRFKMNLFAVSA